MATGIVTTYDDRHGYALVAPDDGGAEILVPFIEITRAGFGPLQRGQKLQYRRIKIAERVKAIELKLVA